MQKPCRLEMNTSGSWKLLGKFDAAVEDATDDILTAAGHLVDALNDKAACCPFMVTMRVTTDEPHPATLMRYRSHESGWRDSNGAPA